MKQLSQIAAETKAFGFSGTSGPQAPVTLFHRHDEIELGLAEYGNVWASIGGVETVIRPGRLVVFWATQPHGPVAVDSGTYAHAVHVPLPFLINCNEIPPNFIRSLLEGKVIFASPGSDSDLPDLILIKHWVALLTQDTHLGRRIVLLEVMARLLRLAAETTSSSPDHAPVKAEVHDSNHSHKRQHFLRIARLIAERCAEPWTIASIAAEIGLNPSYAMRLFKDISGVTIAVCLTQQRVALAQRLLLTTDKKIVDIAFESGFSSVSSFYEMFARVCGKSPSAYRKTS